ncbi:MAG: hypothetical protein HZB70_03465 [Candidatus Berkelbacteria bacterium]|nr:MAG: hypothetical protein HZB70_03465 [Candidatus Berkelbacteria bacterium]QQG51639.1 MAG: hypothetical protein HY845_03725 [Candidatus Berkelbacteria bacterium]
MHHDLARRKKAFSLIEVVFAVSFLIMVGVAMSSLNSAASRLVTTAETKGAAYALNEQSLSYVTILRESLGDTFKQTYESSCVLGETCYVACSQDNLAQNCTLNADPKPVQLGRSRLQFVPEINVINTGNNYLVVAKTTWGKGANRSVVSSQLLE